MSCYVLSNSREALLIYEMNPVISVKLNKCTPNLLHFPFLQSMLTQCKYSLHQNIMLREQVQCSLSGLEHGQEIASDLSVQL